MTDAIYHLTCRSRLPHSINQHGSPQHFNTTIFVQSSVVTGSYSDHALSQVGSQNVFVRLYRSLSSKNIHNKHLASQHEL